nr:hypothetical protein [Tanacetum cinerariifolium]
MQLEQVHRRVGHRQLRRVQVESVAAWLAVVAIVNEVIRHDELRNEKVKALFAGLLVPGVHHRRAARSGSGLQLEGLRTTLDEVTEFFVAVGARVELRPQLGDVGAQRTELDPAVLVSDVVEDLGDKADGRFRPFRRFSRCRLEHVGLGLGVNTLFGADGDGVLAQQFDVNEFVAGGNKGAWRFLLAEADHGQAFLAQTQIAGSAESNDRAAPSSSRPVAGPSSRRKYA